MHAFALARICLDEIKEQILKTGIRKLERDTKISHHTVNRILRGEPVRRKTLAKIVNQVWLPKENERVMVRNDPTSLRR